jgi:hypothetical protein
MHFNIMQFSPNSYYFPLLDPSIFLGSLFNKKKQKNEQKQQNICVKYLQATQANFFPWSYVHMFSKHATKMCFLRIITLV